MWKLSQPRQHLGGKEKKSSYLAISILNQMEEIPRLTRSRGAGGRGVKGQTQQHRIHAERGLWRSPSPPLLSSRVTTAREGCSQLGFQYLHRWRLHSPSGEPGPKFDPLLCKKKVFSYVQMEYHAFPLVPLVLSLGTTEASLALVPGSLELGSPRQGRTWLMSNFTLEMCPTID